MPTTTSRTPVFELVSAISCSSLSGRFSSVLCIWRSSSPWLEVGSLALLLTLCCMSQLFPVTGSISLICCFSLFVTWVFWLAAAAALTQSLGGALDCHTQTEFVYCGQLNALSGFAWLIWFVSVSPYICLTHKLIIVYRVVLTFMFLFVIIQSIMRMRRGEGVASPMVEV
jgi:hypothetical protein